MTIAETLRDCADYMESTLTAMHPDKSQYICDCLMTHRMPQYTAAELKEARRFLGDLGMPQGFSAFLQTGPYDRKDEPFVLWWSVSQIERVCWLHFAADLAEEWGA